MPLTVRANLATQWQGFNGNVTAPMYSFSSAPGSGMFHAGSNGNVGISVNSTEVVQVTPTSLQITGSLVTPSPTMFKNVLINGDMRIMQRGPPAANVGANGASTYTLDRWFVTSPGVANNQVSQVLSQLPGFTYALRCQRPSGVTNVNDIYWGQSLETVNVVPLQGKTMTLSYYARSGDTLTGPVTMRVTSGTGVDQAPSAWPTWTGTATVSNAVLTLSGTWTRFTHTFTMPSNSQELVVAFLKPNVGTAGANDYFDVTGVQLEVGPIATTFEQRPFATELALCQRYYTKSYDVNTTPGSLTEISMISTLSPGTNTSWNPVFKQTLRNMPTIVIYGPMTGATGNCNEINATANYAVAIYTKSIGTQACLIYTTALPARSCTVGIHYTASAELDTIIVTSNMILYLDPTNSTSYPGSGSTWNDLMLLSNATQSASGVTFIPNEPRYFSYNGSTGYHDLTLTNTAGAWAHSVSFWFQLNITQASISTAIAPFFIGNAATLSQCSALIITATTHNWYFYSNDTTFTYSFAQNTWYHMCLTYSGGNANSTNKQLYINGTNVSLTGSSASPLNIAANAQMNIGRNITNAYFFPGKIGEFIVYNGALTAAQALQNFTARRGYYGV